MTCLFEHVKWMLTFASCFCAWQFPYLVDENTGRALYESDAIVRYLYETYGGGTLRPPPMLLESTLLTGCAAGAVRRLIGRLTPLPVGLPAGLRGC